MMTPLSNFLALCENRDKIIIDLLNAAEVQDGDDFKESSYRDSVQHELVRLQVCLEALGKTLSFEAFETIRATEIELLDVVRKIRHAGARDAAIDEITNLFCLSTAYGDQWMATGHAVKLKLTKQLILQSLEPAEVARKHVSEAEKTKFLHSFVELTTDLLHLGMKVEEWQLALFFAELRTYLEEQSRVEGAVEYISAHINLVAPLMEKLVAFSKRGEGDLQATIVLNKLSLDCEFLAGLYAATNHPVVKELGAIASKSPSGRTPFAFLETMGLGLTPDWYHHQMEVAEGRHLLALIKHALVTPGVELNLSQIPTNCDQWKLAGYLEAIITAPAQHQDCASKVNRLMSSLADQCTPGERGQKIRQQIANSGLPPDLLRNHPTLLGDRFSQDLGM